MTRYAGVHVLVREELLDTALGVICAIEGVEAAEVEVDDLRDAGALVIVLEDREGER